MKIFGHPKALNRLNLNVLCCDRQHFASQTQIISNSHKNLLYFNI
jgi:hypothetical protein